MTIGSRFVRQSFQDANGFPIQIAERVALKAIGHDAKEKASGERGRRKPAPVVSPAKAQIVEREMLQLGEFLHEIRADRSGPVGVACGRRLQGSLPRRFYIV